jgi:hypothetical protein
MHQAMSKINPSLYPKIVALVMFGDFGTYCPVQLAIVRSDSLRNSTSGNKGTTVKSFFGTANPAFPPPLDQRLKQNCITGDPVSPFPTPFSPSSRLHNKKLNHACSPRSAPTTAPTTTHTSHIAAPTRHTSPTAPPTLPSSSRPAVAEGARHADAAESGGY